MTRRKAVDFEALAKQARNSGEGEAYLQLDKAGAYRIGVGARTVTSTGSSFFMEVVISLSGGSDVVDLQQLENVLACLKALGARGYSLVYEDSNSILCEIEISAYNLAKERNIVNTLMKKANFNELTNPDIIGSRASQK